MDDDADAVVSSDVGDDDDVKYQIGTIVVDDGTVDDYAEIEEDYEEKESEESDAATIPDQSEESGDKDDFLDQADFDPDDPDRYWGK